jgi:hypothetical protein
VIQSLPIAIDATREQVIATLPAGSGSARFVRLRVREP